MRFYATEIDATKPAGASRAFVKTWGGRAWGPPGRLAAPGSDTATVRASDMGYRTLEADAGGLQLYPATLDQAFAMDRVVNLSPTASGVAAGAGQMILANPAGRYDTLAAAWVSDARPARAYLGAKVYDPTRGYFQDPARATLAQVFGGFALQWYLTESALIVPLRDPSYWLERPIQANRYGGSGGYDGHAGLANTPKPKARGGTVTHPIRNVRPVLLDPTTHTYQCSDAAGGIAQVYEAGAPVFTYQANTSNLFSGSTTTGYYRTDTSRTCFQLNPAGGAPVGEITADVWGDFPTAGAVSNADSLLRYLLAEDAAIPSGNLDTSTFTGAAYTAGVHFHPDDKETGIQAAGRLLQSIGARLVSKRDGRLALLVLRAVPATATPVARYSRATAMSITPEPVDPPAWRIQMAYKRNNTRQAAGVSAAVTGAQLAFINGPGESAAWTSAATATAYPRAQDIGPIGGALMLSADASTVAAGIGGLIGERRRRVWVELPAEDAIARDIGDVVQVTWPLDDLRSGRLGMVLGDRIRAQDGTCTLLVVL